MRNRSSFGRRLRLVALGTALAVFGVTASASASEFTKFKYCPVNTAGVFKCLHSVTTGGEVVLGKKKVPIVNPVTIQGGFSAANEENISTFYGATNGVTLSKTPQPVPGGLLGIVPPESSPPLVKALSAFFFENGLTGVNSTLELAKPATDIRISEFNLVLEEGTALKLPVKIKLENPFLGSKCYVGSDSSPIWWNLTTGTTTPPVGTTPLKGTSGTIELIEEFKIVLLKEAKLVENNWAAPAASGCGGILSFLVNPIINSQVGLPSAAGKNAASLIANNAVATAVAVKNNP